MTATNRPPGRRILRRDDLSQGAVAVEFALIAPVLITLLAGVADFGFAMYERMGISNGARAGAQFAIVSTNNAGNANGILQAVVNGTQKTAAQVNVASAMTCECNGAVVDCVTGVCAGDLPPEIYVTVNVTYQHPLIFPWPGVSNPVPMTGFSRLRLR